MTMNLKLFLFKVDCVIFTRYFKVPYGGDPIADTLLAWGNFSLVYVPLKFRTI